MLDDVCLRPGACADQEDYDTLTRKTLSFLRAAVAAWDAEYFVKVRPDEFWLHNGGAAPGSQAVSSHTKCGAERRLPMTAGG